MPALLFIFAHPDDHLLAAGTLFHYKQKGYAIHEIVLTGGEEGSVNGEKIDAIITKSTRTSEYLAAVKFLKLDSAICYGLPDGNVSIAQKTVVALAHVIRSLKPDIVITHTSHDTHADHRVTQQIVLNAVELAAISVDLQQDEARWRVPNLWYVEGYLPIRAHLMIDVTESQEFKKELLSHYSSQLSYKLKAAMEVITVRHSITLPGEAYEAFEIEELWPSLIRD